MHLLRVVAVLGVAAAGGWVGSTWADGPPFEPIAGLIGAIIVYLGFEVSDIVLARRLKKAESDKGRLSTHDVQLGDRLMDIFDSRVQEFLRDKPFGAMFHENRTLPLEELMSRWDGVDFEFEDVKLQEKLTRLREANAAFVQRINMSVELVENAPGIQYAIPSREERANDLFEKRTWDTIRALQELADPLLIAFEDFKRDFRRRPKPVLVQATA